MIVLRLRAKDVEDLKTQIEELMALFQPTPPPPAGMVVTIKQIDASRAKVAHLRDILDKFVI